MPEGRSAPGSDYGDSSDPKGKQITSRVQPDDDDDYNDNGEENRGEESIFAYRVSSFRRDNEDENIGDDHNDNTNNGENDEETNGDNNNNEDPTNSGETLHVNVSPDENSPEKNQESKPIIKSQGNPIVNLPKQDFGSSFSNYNN